MQEKSSNKQLRIIGISILMVVIIFGLIKLLPSSTKIHKPLEPVITESVKEQPTNTKKEKTEDELMAENEVLLKEMAPKKEQIRKYLNSKIPKKYQSSQWYKADANIVQRDLFDISLEIDIKCDDKELAKKEAIKLFKCISDIPYKISVYHFYFLNNGNPLIHIYKNNEVSNFFIIEGGQSIPYAENDLK